MYDIEKTLFVSDLDGTLLRNDGTLSDETTREINRMTASGLKFALATARSYHTTMKVASGIAGNIPLILHNGTFIREPVNGEYVVKNLLSDIPYIRRVTEENGLMPFVYSIDGGRQRFSYVPSLLSPEAAAYQETRRNDPRDNPVDDPAKIWDGEIFYVTVIDKKERLDAAYECFREKYGCLFGRDYYSGDYWLEILAPEASKAHAMLQLRDMLGCTRVVAFGDAHNDAAMFDAADEAYAVANAINKIKEKATAVIGSNEDGGVVRWLRENVGI